MGFERARAIQALAAKSNKEDALDWLLEQDAQQAAAKAKSAAKPAATQPGKPVAAQPAKPAGAPAAAASKPAVTKPAATASSAAAAKPVAASSSSVKPASSASSSSASSLTAPLKKMTLDEQKAFDQREKKRLELLKLLEQEAEEKLKKAKERAAAAATVNQAVRSNSGPVKSASSSSSSSSSSSVAAPPSATPSASSKAEQTAEEKKIQQIAEARAAQEERVRLAQLRVQKRLEAEKNLKSVDQVCKMLRANYDALRYESILQMVRRLLEKIIADGGKTEKYRRIPLANPRLEQTLVRPIGAVWLLKSVGFVEEKVKDADRTVNEEDALLPEGSPLEEQRVLILPAKAVDLKKLQALSTKLAAMLQSHSSIIPSVFAEMLASKKYTIEQVYHLALELRMITQNIIVSTDETDLLRSQQEEDEAGEVKTDDSSMEDISAAKVRAARRAESTNKNFRTLDKHEVSYTHRIKPIAESKKILAELGFQLDPHDLTKQFLVVPYETIARQEDDSGQPVGLKKYQTILRELNQTILQLQPQTSIAVGLKELCAQNRRKPTEKFVELVQNALKTILLEPHAQKYHKLRLDKLQSKIGSKEAEQIKGMAGFLKLFGFEPRPDAETGVIDEKRVALEYPGFDETQLKMRYEELNARWSELLAQAAAEAGGASQHFDI